MFSLTVVDHIMVAHSFRGAEFGPAQRLHGATFVVEAEFRAPEIDDLHLLIDIGLAKDELRKILSALDYRNLDEVPEFAAKNTTTEFLCLHIHGLLAAACRDGRMGPGGGGVTGIKVLLRESHVAWAAFEGPLMKIALFVPTPFDTVSGGYLYDRRLMEGLRALDHEVRVVELDGQFPMPDETAEVSARAAFLTLAGDEIPLIDGLALPAFASLASELAARSAVALIHHPTSLEPGPHQQALAERERALFAACGRLVVTSPYTAKGLPPLGADPSRIGVVEPGTDPAPRAIGSGGPGARILSVGSLIPRKGHDVLLRALARLTDLEWTLRIAGPPADPVHAEGLAALAEELGLTSRVTFLGSVNNGTLEQEYAAADLFALATHFEGFGMAAAEAQARGLPLALCTGGAIADLVGPGAAILAAPGDANSLSRGMRRPLFDTALRATMAEASWAAGQALPRWEDRATRFVAELEAAGHG